MILCVEEVPSHFHCATTVDVQKHFIKMQICKSYQFWLQLWVTNDVVASTMCTCILCDNNAWQMQSRKWNINRYPHPVGSGYWYLLHFVAFFHLASLFSTGVDNEKALELTNSTVFHRGRQWKSSRAGQQNIFFIFQPDFNVEISPKNATKHPVA